VVRERHLDWERDIVLQGGNLARFKDGRLTIRMLELPLADGVNGSTGHQIWPGSEVLATELLRRPQLVANKRVLEMGSGCALVGITSAHLARYTLMTDHDEEVVSNVQQNLRVNARSWMSKDGEPRREAATCRMDWEEVPIYGWEEADRFDTILAAEVIYGNWGDKVARAMVELLAPGGTMLMSVSEDRRGSIGAFKDQIYLSGFKVRETKIFAPAGTVRVYECTAQADGEDKFSLLERHDNTIGAYDTAQAAPWRPKPSVEAWKSNGVSRDLKPGKVDAAASRPVRPPPPPANPTGPRATAAPSRSPAVSKESTRPSWHVVGGVEKGIIVREGSDGAKSEFKGRLEHGALVEEVQRIGDKVQYQLISGHGPSSGWLSIFTLKGTRLLAEGAAY